MKSFAILAATFAGAAIAQDMPMPEGDCANLCINNMATIAQTDFQCEQSNIGCFCTQSNWAYGIRDCTRQACDADQSAAAVQWAYARCAGVAATGSDTPAALPILTSAVASATAVAPSATGSVASSVSGAVSSIASSAASGLESITSSVASEISSAISSASDALASASSSIASELASATDSAGNAISSATEAAGSAASSATEAAGSAASSVAQDAAPKATAMPLLAGAGIAAWLLL